MVFKGHLHSAGSAQRKSTRFLPIKSVTLRNAAFRARMRAQLGAAGSLSQKRAPSEITPQKVGLGHITTAQEFIKGWMLHLLK